MIRTLSIVSAAAAMLMFAGTASADHLSGRYGGGVRGGAACYGGGGGYGGVYGGRQVVGYRTVTLGQVRGIGYGVPIGRVPVVHSHVHPRSFPSYYSRSLANPYYNYYRGSGVNFSVRSPSFGLRIGF